MPSTITALDTIDLSSVTDLLTSFLTTKIPHSSIWSSINAFTYEVSGLMPEAARNNPGCQLTFYLFHVSPAPQSRNVPVANDYSQPRGNRTLPLGLDLFYLLTAYSSSSSDQEQQLMGACMQLLHENSIFNGTGSNNQPYWFTVTLEPETHDEANRRWQSYSTPFRMSVVYRVSVVFLTSSADTAPPAPAPQKIGLSVAPSQLPPASGGAIVAATNDAVFSPANPTPTDTITYQCSPTVVTLGGVFTVLGDNLDAASSAFLYILDSSGVETQVPWIVAGSTTASRVDIQLPAAFGALPASCPSPGIYQVRMGDAAGYRSNSIPLFISAQVVTPVGTWNPTSGVFTFTGAGFVDPTKVYLETVALEQVLPLGSIPVAGQFSIDATRDSISFVPPAGLLAGGYTVQLRCGGVEGPPVGQIVLP